MAWMNWLLRAMRATLLPVVAAGVFWVTMAGFPSISAYAAAGTAPPTALCGGGSGCVNPQAVGIPEVSVGSGVSGIVTILSFVAGVLSVVFLIIGGIRYSTSDGSSHNVEQAKLTIIFAIAGLALSIMAPIIVDFVIANGPQ